jgi:hypothetical protein
MDEKEPKSQSGGVNIGGNVGKVGGDIVGGDKVTHGDSVNVSDVGAGAAVAAGRGASASVQTGAETSKLFEELLNQVTQQAPAEKQAEAQQKVALLQEQVKAKQPDVGLVGKALKWLKKNVPGVSSTLKSVLNQPIIGQSIKDVATVILEDDED